MKQRRHTPEQVIRKLAEGEKLLAEGETIEEVSRHLEISDQIWHRWRNQYVGMKADDAKRLKELEKESARLRSSWPRPSSTSRCSRSWLRETSNPDRRRRAVVTLIDRFGVSQRHACRVVGQHRATQRHAPSAPSDDEMALRAWLRAFSLSRPRSGWRRPRCCSGQGWRVNNKRIQRLWRLKGSKSLIASARSHSVARVW